MRRIFFALFIFSANLALADELWVGSYFGDNIKRYDLSNGSLLGTTGTGKLDGTLGLTLGPGGKIFACSELTGSVETFDAAGNWISRFGTAKSPTGIDFDAQGNGYVSQFNENSVAKLSSTGANLGDFVAAGSGGLNGPDLGIKFGPDGNLYVPSFNSGDFLRYDGKTGAFIDKFIAAGSGGLTQPRQIIWRDGKVYVTSDNGNKVLRYNATTGAFIDTFVTSGSGGLNGATGMVFCKDSLYITSWRNNKVLKYNGTTGAFESAFVTSGLSGPVSLLVVPEPKSLTIITGGLALLAFRRLKFPR